MGRNHDLGQRERHENTKDGSLFGSTEVNFRVVRTEKSIEANQHAHIICQADLVEMINSIRNITARLRTAAPCGRKSLVIRLRPDPPQVVAPEL